MQLAARRTLVSEVACIFEFRDGLFYIADMSLDVTRAMRPDAFFQTIANAVECSRQYRPWEKPSAEIINLADHAAASGNSGK